MNNNLNYATYNYPNLMITGKSIPPQQKSVPSSTNIAFGRGITTITRRKQQQQLNEKQNYLNKNKTIIRRSGSAGQLADNNRRESTISTSAVSVFNTSTQNSRRVVCNCRNGNCKCVPSMAFLEGVYVQNLQTQIEVLELENAYLRGATDRGALFAKQPTTEDNYYNNIQKQRNSSNLFNNHEKRKINKKDEFEDKKEEIILNNLLLKKEKRVGFFNGENEKRKEIIKDWEESFDYSGGDDSDNNNNWKRRNEERKIKEEEEEEKRFLLLERRKEKKEFEEREELVKQEIRIKEAEISRIKGERQELERKLRLAEGFP
ncbi:unnamed protein product [Meloidogyne enterolobii]|uniref:Uncharacterized protein n=1 Tax=Meloidogyne enterolobii TaxID=390850 RepID=A0ACB0YJ95_MELEN